MVALTPDHLHLDSGLPTFFQTFRFQPLGRLSYRFDRQNNVSDDFQASTWNRRLAALPNWIRYPLNRQIYTKEIQTNPNIINKQMIYMGNF